MSGMYNTTCAVHRLSEVYTGPTSTKTWSANETGIACRIQQLSGREINEIAPKVEISHRIFLPYGVDVTEVDRIVCNGFTYQIITVDPDVGSVQHHMELVTVEIKNG